MDVRSGFDNRSIIYIYWAEPGRHPGDRQRPWGSARRGLDCRAMDV